MQNSNQAHAASPARIISMASAFYDSCILFTASDLGIFATLADAKTATADMIAQRCQLNPRGTQLLLDACVALQLLTKQGDHYSNTPEANAFLVPGQPGDLSRAIRYNRDVYPAWGKLAELVKTGAPVEKPDIHLGDDPARTRAFVLSMHGRAMGIGRSVVPRINLQGRRQLLDIGGGPATYSMLLAKANPALSCTVIDLPGVVAVARELIASEKLESRVSTIPGSYHTTPFPSNNDAVIFFGVLHQESPESILALFRKAHQSLAPGGVIYVLDMMTDPTHTSPPFSALFAVNMALTTQHGWVFSDKELQTWLQKAGFRNFACTPLPPPMPHWLASAEK